MLFRSDGLGLRAQRFGPSVLGLALWAYRFGFSALGPVLYRGVPRPALNRMP